MAIFMVITFLSIPRVGYPGWGWVIYHERSFKGRVIDDQTKEPIEGVVVVARYQTNMWAIVESHTRLTDVQEALTDKRGEFTLPSLTKLINPLSVGYYTYFLIWKPGYKAADVRDDYFFTKEPGTVEDRVVQTDKGFEKKPMRLGIVELVRVQTDEERKMALIDPIGEKSDWKKQRQLIKMVRGEWERITGKPAGNLYQIGEDN